MNDIVSKPLEGACVERFFVHRWAIALKREGPLGPYFDELAHHFAERGYSRHHTSDQLRLAAEFSRWLMRRHAAISDLVADDLKDFLRFRARTKIPPRGRTTVFKLIYELLGQRGIIASPPPVVIKQTPVQKLVSAFRLYLDDERHLATATVVHYVRDIEDWLQDEFGDGPVIFSKLSTPRIVAYIRQRASVLARKTTKAVVSALRSFLQFARYRGYIQRDLAISIPTIANWSRTSIPMGLPQEHVRRVLAHCNRKTRIGRRDYAILLLLARLGLRAGEVALLALDDIDWDNGRITIHGKGGQDGQLPLPHDVGKAIATYLKQGRPRSTNRRLFLRGQAPVGGFKGAVAVSCLVDRALTRAGIEAPHRGAHPFRYALATDMLRRGASLAEIGEVLRHRHPQTTAIYAKVDLTALRPLALPWPKKLPDEGLA